MANLKSVLEDTADAIRSKTGGSSLIAPVDFATAIGSIAVSSEAQGYRNAVVELLKGTETSIDFSAYPEITTCRSYLGYGDTILTSVNMGNVVAVPDNCFAECSNLTSVVMNVGTTTIGNSAFYNCRKIDNLTIPHTLTNIGESAFYYVGTDTQHTFDFIDNVGVETSFGTYCFQGSKLGNLQAVASNIGDNAFNSCSSLSTVNIKINGSVGNSAFNQCTRITQFTIDASSNITSLSSRVFYYLAQNTYATTSISPFDFRNSTFTTLQGNVWFANYYAGTIYFPSTLTTISGNAWGSCQNNWLTYFNSIPSVSSSSYLPSDSANFTIKYCFPLDLYTTATTTTNWLNHTSQMLPYITNVASGVNLPKYDRTTGVLLDWFSDTALTTSVTVSTGANVCYYATMGSTRVVWFVDTPTLVDASVVISDGTNTYTSGDAIPVNTSITITPNYTDNTKTVLYMLIVNGVDYTSQGSATITMTQDLQITAIYYDGVNIPFFPNLADNSWDKIQLASKSGNIPSTWQVGDTKTFTYDGVTHTARLVDKSGKFTRHADGTTAYLYFEDVNCLETNEVFSSNDNTVSTSPLLASMNSGTIYGKIDSALTSIIEEVDVLVAPNGIATATTTTPFKFFLAREGDLFSSIGYSVPAEFNAINQDQYYQTHNTNNDRKKAKLINPTNYLEYWEMSPYYTSANRICVVITNGSASATEFNNLRGVSLRFAL